MKFHGGDDLAQRRGGSPDGRKKLFGCFDLPDGEFERREINPGGGGLRGQPVRRLGECTNQIAAGVTGQRFGKRVGFGFVEGNVSGVEHTRIIKTPLNQVRDGQHGGDLRGLAGLHPRLLTARELQLLGGGFEFNRSIQQGKPGRSIRLGGEQKFRAANRARGQWRLELNVGGLLAVQEKYHAAFESETMPRGRRGRLDFDDGGLVDANGAAVGKLQRGAAVRGGAKPIPRMQELIGERRVPAVGSGGGHFDFAGKLNEPAAGRSVGGRQRLGAKNRT